jgi:hypothetical protein
LGADASLTQTRQIGLQRLLRLANVELSERQVLLHAELERKIVMAIDKQSLAVNAPGFVREFHWDVIRGFFLRKHGVNQRKEECENHR